MNIIKCLNQSINRLYILIKKDKYEKKNNDIPENNYLTLVSYLWLCLRWDAEHGYSSDKVSYNQLTRLPLGNVTAQGWLKVQLERNKAGMGGHLDELEPEMIAKPYVDRNHKSKVSPGWSGEISGTYWTGLVQLAFTLNDEELIAKARKWVYSTLALQEEDGYLGNYRKTENRLEDYCAWSANWCYRALLHWYDATGDKESWMQFTADYCGLLRTGQAIRRHPMLGRH